MSDIMKSKDVLEAEQAKQQLAKVSLRIKELEDELRILGDGISRVRLKAKGLAVLTTMLSLE